MVDYLYDEESTYDRIIERELNEARRMMNNNLDIREGSITFTSIAPAAVEFAESVYPKMAQNRDNRFPDTCDMASLEKFCKLFIGITRKPAVAATVQGTLNVPVEIGQRFNLANSVLNYEVISCVEDDKAGYIMNLKCETAGSEGNVSSGILLPIGGVNGLIEAKITALIIPGEEQETHEELYKRFEENIQFPAFGGNVQDYKNKVLEGVEGVGAVKVYPVWDGAGTVKIVILDSTYGAPSEELISNTKNLLDPIDGQGMGLAPIDHVVTVEGCAEATINVSTKITFKAGYTWNGVKSTVESSIKDYLSRLAEAWADSDSVVVRSSRIDAAILEADGVLDVADTMISIKDGKPTNGNLDLGADTIPILGVITNG